MLPSAKDRLWYIKHRPSKIDDYAFTSNSDQELVDKIIQEKSIPHLLLSGPPGTGKTTLALLLASHCISPENYDTDVLIINASDNNSVDDVREMIKNHITSYASGDYKLVILQEADYLSANAQGILRDYMEIYEAHARFILTCNALHKIDGAIKSRCQRLVIDNPDKKKIAPLLANMLISEGVKIPTADVIFEHLNAFYPDIRSIIQSLQQHSASGTLRPPSGSLIDSEVKTAILTHMKNDSWLLLASSLPTMVPDYAWDEVFELVYKNLEVSPTFNPSTPKWGDAILTICEYMTQMDCAKPAINGSAFCVQMHKLRG